MEKAELENLLAKASKIKKPEYNYDTPELDFKRKCDGAKRFKRKAIGFRKSIAVKSLDEMAQILYDLKIVSSIEEGRKITPDIFSVEKHERYPVFINYDESLCYSLRFETVQDEEGKEAYKIRAYTFNL